MLRWAGIDFGEENTLRLQKSIKVSFLLFKKKEANHIPLFFAVEIGYYEWS